MESQLTVCQEKKQSYRLFAVLCAVFLSLYIIRDVVGIKFSYYIIYVFAAGTLLILPLEQAICFFMAISAFTNAGLNGVFCTTLFACVLVRFVLYMRTIKMHSLLLVAFSMMEFLHYLRTGKLAIGSLLTYAMILLALAVVQQYPHQKLDKARIVNSFIIFSLTYVIIVLVKTALEYGSLAELLENGLRTEEYGEMIKVDGISPNQNYLTQLSSLNLCLCALMIRQKYKRIPYICAMAVFTVCGLLTVSKMFVIVMAALALAAVFFAIKKHGIKAVGMIALVAFCAILIYRYFGDTLIQMVMNRFEKEDLTTGRFEINDKLLAYMNTHPWMYFVGAGILQVHYLGQNAIHSSVFEILGGWGVFGLVFAAAYVVLLIKEAKDNMKLDAERMIGYHYLPLLLLLGYTLAGMLFSQSFTVVQIMVCIYAMQVKEKDGDVVQHNRTGI
jgi:hypothetical protein